MRGFLDFSSWSGLLTTLFGLVLVSLVAVGIRLVFMQTLQRRRERENRQINERLKTLIAAYKTLSVRSPATSPWTRSTWANSAAVRRPCPMRSIRIRASPNAAAAPATRWKRRCRT